MAKTYFSNQSILFMRDSRKKGIKKPLTVAILGSVILAAGTATSAFTFSWFSNTNNVTNKTLEGHTAGAYFARGRGSSNDPYVINSPIHLYNLAWLYYIGYFDGQEPCFIIEKDLDMSGWTLPPIGTKDHPFNGHLDGYDTTYSKTSQTEPVTIKNLTVSNDFGSYNTHPANITSSTFTSPEITGLFGYIASDSTSSSKPTPSVKNLYIDNETVTSKTSHALSGIVAGYVDGELEGIHLNNSKLDINSGTSNISGFNNISDYTSVGYTTSKSSYVKNVTTLYEPYFVGKSSFADQSGGGGSGNDWGASINMQTINRRINYMVSSYTKYEKSGTATRFTQSSRFNLYARYGQTGEWYWNDQKATINGYANLAKGTIIPLTINTDEAFVTDGVKDKENEITLNSYAYHITDFYDSSSVQESDIIANSNSGYFIGGGTMDDSGTISTSSGGYLYIRRQLVSSAMSSAGQSSTQGTAYSSSSTIFRYINESGTEGTLTLTKDEQGNVTGNSMNYERANSVINQFNTTMEGKRWAQGLRFYGTDNLTSSSNYTDYLNAKLIGKTYSKYQFLQSGLNFTVKEKGYITVIMSTAMSAKVMFELYKISRSGCSTTANCSDEHSVTNVEQIKQIYKYQSGTDSSGNAKYSYDYNTNSHNGTLAFDFTKISPSTENALYYFEIPVEPGDYLIGKNEKGTSNNTAFIVYLDIGTSGNGSEATSNTVYRTKVLELLKQINSTFTYPTGVYVTDLSKTDIVNDKKTYCVQLGKTYSGTATMDVSNNTATTSLTTTSTDTGVAYFDDSLTVSENGTAITIDNAISESKAETQSIRLTYYDHYYGDGTDELYVYMMETSSSSDIPTTFTGYAGSKADDGIYTLSSGGKEKFYDDTGAEAEPSSISPSEYDISNVNTSTPVISLRNVDTLTYLPTGSVGTDLYYGSTFSETNPTPSGYNITASAITDRKIEEISRNSSYTINLE